VAACLVCSDTALSMPIVLDIACFSGFESVRVHCPGRLRRSPISQEEITRRIISQML